jgi:hypothetical protein
MLPDTAASKVTTAHLSRRALLYVRQSSLKQVIHNTESAIRQYDLRGKAIALGWAADQVTVIDTGPGPVRSQRRGPGRIPAAGRRGVPRQGRDRAGPGVLPAGPQQRRLASAPGCATRRCVFVRRWKGSAAGPSQRSGEAGGSLIRGSPGRAGAASTTSGRAGTARRPGSG